MRIEKSVVGPVAVLTLSGDLDAGAAEAVADDVALVPEGADVLIDLGSVAHLTSAGLRVLLRLYRQAQCSRTAVALVGLSPELHNLLDAAGFLDYFTVAGTVPDGVEVLTGDEPREAVDA